MKLPTIDPKELAPLLQGSWHGNAAVFAVLTTYNQVVVAAVRKAWGSRKHTSLYENMEELSQQVFLRLAEKAELGLKPPPDWEQRLNGAPWLFTVVRNTAESLLRREVKFSTTPPPRDADSVRMNPVEVIAFRQDIQRFLSLQDDPSVALHHLLALWASHAPALLKPEILGPLFEKRGWSKSLPRPPQQTLQLLAEWARRQVGDTDSVEARRELAWILRILDDPLPPWWETAARWHRANPDSAASALDLVRKWSARGNRWKEDT